MNHGYQAAVSPPEKMAEAAKWFVFQRSRLLVQIEDGRATLPELTALKELGLTIIRQQYLGTFNGQHCISAEVGEDTDPPEGWVFQSLRRLFGVLPEELFWVTGAAVQIVDWDRTHQYCGRCGEHTDDHLRERAKECPNCGLISYPRISPAIIVLIEKDNEVLLARSLRHPKGMYSVLAGFVEPGESLEATVIREIKEEVGLQVKDIRYFGSQPWPFPNSLMIAFTCTYAAGDIKIEEEEMADAGWYRPDNFPMIPPQISIARQMIDWFVARHGSK
jgi:NAD+ diphosphatase